MLRLFEAKSHTIRKVSVIALLAFLVFVQVVPILSQEEQPDGPVYIVKEGDSLWSIAVRFGVSLEDLQKVNGINDPGILASGDRLNIPGLRGVSGIIDTVEVPLGETLRSLSRRYRVTADELARMNRLTSPAELFVGSNLILPVDRLETKISSRNVLQPGQSLLEFAVLNNANPWSIVEINDLKGMHIYPSTPIFSH